SGNVGIGTTTPITPFQVGSMPLTLANIGETPAASFGGLGLWVTPTNSGRGLRISTTDFVNGAGAGTRFSMGLGAATGNTYGELQVTNSGTGRTGILVLNTLGGSVGIGTTSPATTLSVNGSGYLTGTLGVGANSTDVAGVVSATRGFAMAGSNITAGA